MFRQYRPFTRFLRYYRVYVPNKTRKLLKIGRVQFLIGSQVFCVPKMSEDVDSQEKLEDEITRAIEEGEAATVKLMIQIKDFLVIVSDEYRRCIKKQIVIMKKSTSQAGPYSEAQDELLQYRSLANELKKEIQDYCTLFNTVVNMASNENKLKLVNHRDEEELTEFQKLQNEVEKEIELNSKCEKELLQAVTDNILLEVLFDASE